MNCCSSAVTSSSFPIRTGGPQRLSSSYRKKTFWQQQRPRFSGNRCCSLRPAHPRLPPVADTAGRRVVEVTVQHAGTDIVVRHDIKAAGRLQHGDRVHIRFNILFGGRKQLGYFGYILNGKHLQTQCFQEFLLALYTADIPQLVRTEAHILAALFPVQVLLHTGLHTACPCQRTGPRRRSG